LVTVGDSITFGVGVTTPWPSLITSTGYTLHNIAVSGSNCPTHVTSDVYSFYTPGQKNTLYVWCGTNNIAGGQSASSTYSTLSTYIAEAMAIGFYVITATMLSRDSPAGLDTARNAYNTLILANTAGANAVVDFTGTQLGCNGCATTSGDFNVDLIHPNNTGETGIIVPAMQAVLP